MNEFASVLAALLEGVLSDTPRARTCVQKWFASFVPRNSVADERETLSKSLPNLRRRFYDNDTHTNSLFAVHETTAPAASASGVFVHSLDWSTSTRHAIQAGRAAARARECRRFEASDSRDMDDVSAVQEVAETLSFLLWEPFEIALLPTAQDLRILLFANAAPRWKISMRQDLVSVERDILAELVQEHRQWATCDPDYSTESLRVRFVARSDTNNIANEHLDRFVLLQRAIDVLVMSDPAYARHTAGIVEAALYKVAADGRAFVKHQRHKLLALVDRVRCTALPPPAPLSTSSAVMHRRYSASYSPTPMSRLSHSANSTNTSRSTSPVSQLRRAQTGSGVRGHFSSV